MSRPVEAGPLAGEPQQSGEELRAKRRLNPAQEGLDRTGLYHSFRLPDGRILPGTMALSYQEERLASFPLPQNLEGKEILDIGPWDGYFTFELERRGATVTAADYADLDTFRELHHYFHSNARYLQMDIYELTPATVGTFDFVLCMGVLYHLKHPLLALERVCSVTREFCLLDTYVVDGEAWQRGEHPALPYLEFYEADELAGQTDNWCGPTVGAVEAMVRAAGFAQAEVVRVTDNSVRIAAHRKWQRLPPDSEAPVQLLHIHCHLHRGRTFRTEKEEYLVLWCTWEQPAPPELHDIFPEVNGFGVAPLSRTLTPSGLLVTMRIPPGLAPGAHTARLKIGSRMWSGVETFYVDLPPVEAPVQILALQDSVSWATGAVQWSNGGWLTVWLSGLSPEADPGNTKVWIGDTPHLPESVHVERGQVNTHLRPVVHPGTHTVRVTHRGITSNPIDLTITGDPPIIHGLEELRRTPDAKARNSEIESDSYQNQITQDLG